MNVEIRLSDKEYEELSIEYEQNPPKLSGQPGFLTNMRERTLVTELLSPDYARIVNMIAKSLSLSPSEVIQNAIKTQLVENTKMQQK
jgi:hypothetical protein